MEDPTEQAILRQMLVLRQSEGPTAIAATLNASGTTTRRGGRWSPQLVHKILAAYDSREACLASQ